VSQYDGGLRLTIREDTMRTIANGIAAAILVVLAVANASAQPPALQTPRLSAVVTAPSFQPGAAPPADPVWDGIALGAVIGAGACLGTAAILFARCDEGCEAPEPGPVYAFSAAFGGATGAFVGWLLDRANKPKPGSRAGLDVVPVLTGPRKAVIVKVNF
jgi:hypothetical protein